MKKVVIPFVLSAVLAATVTAQLSSWPHDYPGKPSTPFGPDWQEYFRVKDPLPNITWPLSRHFAGNIPVDRAGHPNDTLFFWAVEHRPGSLTEHTKDTEPWGIWLNGGPGSSSLLGFGYENGPIRFSPRGSRSSPNNYTWANLIDYFWIDQPVNVGWATADADGNVHDEDEVGRDFFAFLKNLVAVFPSLRTRPLYLTGESYAGIYIPYIMKTYFGMKNPPVNIVTIAIGNGIIGSDAVHNELPTVTILETYPQLIGYDPQAFEYFREQEHLCGFDLNLTYPQTGGTFPSLEILPPTIYGSAALNATRDRLTRLNSADRSKLIRSVADSLKKREASIHKRSFIPPGPSGTINPRFGCYLFDEVLEYAFNYSQPYFQKTSRYYDIPDTLAAEDQLSGDPYFNNATVRAAIHAPTSKYWYASYHYFFAGVPGGYDPSEPMVFLSELAANASDRGIRVVLYSGNDDSLDAHRGTEVVIQNTTFGGIQGFTRKPSTPWYDDHRHLAGIVHQERNWTYILVKDVGHLVPYNSPERGFVLFRDFILGHKNTGLVVTHKNGTVSVVGGEDPALAGDALVGQPGIYVGTGNGDSITTTGTYTYPAETVAAWESYLATATATTTPSESSCT
ncbi:alpha/beta-hydrolase [Lentinus tigrinus ALCF2SS1-7]|uniref:Carboxypeptidase n=1 Tax=Lentinus tigrinus ALCF2SS1-6 TaxID=1328759 RepID=A0A5C2SB59_9APHY|nr:alpha/beta-hydrolase [Lentinus tigrinus ALCF2SS1-6]RPD75067.1 alpha/beta-hydrolase [Lentinus tigrinus ALCF2SS1-7]